jgi:hypothetical protein
MTYSVITEEIKVGNDSNLPVDISGSFTVECDDIVGDSDDKRDRVDNISRELREAIDDVLDEHRMEDQI